MERTRVLVDTSIWIDHINGGVPRLVDLLKQRRTLLHPMIVGEIALGSIGKRSRVLEDLCALPQAPVVGHAEVMAMIEWLKLSSTGIGYVDAHLLASVRQIEHATIWSDAKRLHAQAERLDVAYKPA